MDFALCQQPQMKASCGACERTYRARGKCPLVSGDSADTVLFEACKRSNIPPANSWADWPEWPEHDMLEGMFSRPQNVLCYAVRACQGGACVGWNGPQAAFTVVQVEGSMCRGLWGCGGRCAESMGFAINLFFFPLAELDV